MPLLPEILLLCLFLMHLNRCNKLVSGFPGARMEQSATALQMKMENEVVNVEELHTQVGSWGVEDGKCL